MTGRNPLKFQPGEEPDYWIPKPEHPHHRFVLGRVLNPTTSQDPLVVIAMNPSYADHSESDRTVNTVIAASSALGHDGWIMLNLYPERATKPQNLKSFDAALWAQNWSAIENVLDTFGLTEVFGAWGDPSHSTIREAKRLTLAAFKTRGTRVYYFKELNATGNPRHPTPRNAEWPISGPRKFLKL